jgi:hypothetical protein
VEHFSSHRGEAGLSAPQGFSPMWMWIVLEGTIDCNDNTSSWTIDLSLKLDDGQLSLPLGILDYATFAPSMQ